MQWIIMQKLRRRPLSLVAAERVRRFGEKWLDSLGTVICALLLLAPFAPPLETQTMPGTAVHHRGMGTNDLAVAGATLGDGRTVAAGGSQDNPSALPQMAYFMALASGSPDMTYGNNGWLVANTGANSAAFLNSLYFDSLNRTVGAGGSFDPIAGIYKGLVETRDPFGVQSWLKLLQAGTNSVTIINAIAAMPDGGIAYAATTSPTPNPGDAQNLFGLLLANGNVDQRCNGTGQVVEDSGFGDISIAIDPNNPNIVYVSSETRGANTIQVKSFLLPGCTPNPAWGVNGVTTTDFGATFNVPNGLTVDASSNLYVVGAGIDSTGSSTPAVRQLDFTGANSWLRNAPWSDFYPGTANSVTIVPDGSLVVGGEAVNGPQSYPALVNLNTVDGTVNTTWAVNGYVLTNLGAGRRGAIYSVIVTRPGAFDSGITAVGTAYNPPPDNNGRFLFQKYDMTGNPDITFLGDDW